MQYIIFILFFKILEEFRTRNKHQPNFLLELKFLITNICFYFYFLPYFNIFSVLARRNQTTNLREKMFSLSNQTQKFENKFGEKGQRNIYVKTVKGLTTVHISVHLVPISLLEPVILINQLRDRHRLI